jgi:RHS repeat-associated protein
MAFAENSFAEQGKQPCKYNGKELDRMHGLNLYDYSARQMEPALGRFTTMDPMCEKYYEWSPYAYAGNNPMKYVDPTGMMMDWYLDLHKGQIEHQPGSDDRFNQAKIRLAEDDAKVSEIEDALTEKGYDFKKDASVEGGYSVDTREQYQGWKMMQVFSPGNVAAALGMCLSGELEVARGGRAISSALGKGLTSADKGGSILAKIPVGRRGNVLNVVTKNTPTTINGTKFTGHALDQMQSRGILSPSAVLDVVKNPAKMFPGNTPGTMVFIRDNLKVITNKAGDVITVIPR